MSSKKPSMRETTTARSTGLKSVLKSPFILKWPTVSATVKAEFQEELQNSLDDVARKKVKTRERSKGKTKDACKDSTSKRAKEAEQPVEPSTPFNTRKRQCMSVGLKETVRALEKGTLIGGILCLTSCPADLQSWVLGLVGARGGVPFVGLHQVGPLLARLFNVASVLALGLRAGAEEEVPGLCRLLTARAPRVAAPWLAAKCSAEPVPPDVIDRMYDSPPVQIVPEIPAEDCSGKEDAHRGKEMQLASRKRAHNKPNSPVSGHGQPPAKKGSLSDYGSFKSPAPSGLLSRRLATPKDSSEEACKRLSFSPIYQSANIARTPIIPKSAKNQKKKQAHRK